jgi:hypothetical protein
MKTAIMGLHGGDTEKINAVLTELRALENAHNTLIDILQRQIKILELSIANGITVDSIGTGSLGLASGTTAGALSATDWGAFNGKQAHSNELDALSALIDTAGFVKKTGDGAYSIDTNIYATDNNSIAYAIALG